MEAVIPIDKITLKNISFISYHTPFLYLYDFNTTFPGLCCRKGRLLWGGAKKVNAFIYNITIDHELNMNFMKKILIVEGLHKINNNHETARIPAMATVWKSVHNEFILFI